MLSSMFLDEKPAEQWPSPKKEKVNLSTRERLRSTPSRRGQVDRWGAAVIAAKRDIKGLGTVREIPLGLRNTSLINCSSSQIINTVLW